MTKKEMAIAVEIYEGSVETGRILSSLFDNHYTFCSSSADTPLGKVSKAFDLLFEYVPTSNTDLKVEEKLCKILHDNYLTTDERIEAIERLRNECKAKKPK